MSYTAQDVKKLRDETDAPMMECKAALEEAGGDFERAKEILREKGKASAGKKAGRATNAGRVAIVLSEDGKTAGIAVVESETDFVSNNEGFVGATADVAKYALENGTLDDAKKKEFGDDIIAKFRENCVVKVAEQVKSDSKIAYYVHHDGSNGVIVLSSGDGAGSEAVRQIAVHISWGKPQYTTKDELPQEKLDSEYKIEYERAIQEGKPANIAENIAKGRVNKEYVKQVVLLEQPFYKDQGKSVSTFLGEEAKGTTVTGFKFYGVGSDE